MAIISQETWNKFTEEEKALLRDEYASQVEETIAGHWMRQCLDIVFGKTNLQTQIRNWKDIVSVYPEQLKEPEALNDAMCSVNPDITLKLVATFKIAKLIEHGYGGMVTEKEWKEHGSDNGFYCLWANSQGGIECTLVYDSKEFIAFHNLSQAEDFMCYPENVQLIKDYYMI